MKKLMVLALALVAVPAFAASLLVGAGSVSGSQSATTGGSAALSAQNGGGIGIAASRNQTTNTGAVLTASQTNILGTTGGTVSANQTTSTSGAFHAQTGGIGAAAAGGLGAGQTGGASFSGFVLTLP